MVGVTSIPLMPWLDKNKRKEAIYRLRAKRHASGQCSYCGQPLKGKTMPVEPVKPVPLAPKTVSILDMSMVKCLVCRRPVPRVDVDLKGHCLRCR